MSQRGGPLRLRSEWYLGAVARKLIYNLAASARKKQGKKRGFPARKQTKARCARGGLWHQIHAQGGADARASQFPTDVPSQSTDSPTRSRLVPSRPSVPVLTRLALHPQQQRLPLRVWSFFPKHRLPACLLPSSEAAFDFFAQSCPPPPMTRPLLPLPQKACSPAPGRGRSERSCYSRPAGPKEPEVPFSSMLTLPLFLGFLYPPKHQLPRICVRWAGERVLHPLHEGECSQLHITSPRARTQSL